MQLKKIKLTRRIVKRLIILFLIFLVVVCALYAWLSHGVTWSFQSLAYERLMDDLPTPPGFLPESEYVSIFGYHSTGFKRYRALEEHVELINFFSSQLPSIGWQLTGTEGFPVDANCKSCFLSTDLYFSYNERYLLQIELLTEIDDARTEYEDYTLVLITISERE